MASETHEPLVSVILTTRDRPRFLTLALRCYSQQAYRRRELIVVDDGMQFPVPEGLVEAAGGRLIRVEPGTPLGAKLNRGVGAASGRLCQKMDDDDWYGPDFVSTMVAGLLASWRVVCTPTLSVLMPFLFFDVERWEIRRSLDNNAPGATFLFAREDWQERPFRAVRQDEDTWFMLDHLHAGGKWLAVDGLNTFLAVRHTGALADRGHTWTHQGSGITLETHMRERPLHSSAPEALLPEWALTVYRDVRRDVLAAAHPP